MASLAAGFWRQTPVALVPCLSWSSAAPVFTEGVLADALPWKNLAAQYLATPVLQELQGGITRGEYGAKYINGGCIDFTPTLFSPPASGSLGISLRGDDDGLGSTLLEETLRHLPSFVSSNNNNSAAEPASISVATTTASQQSRRFSTSPHALKSKFVC